MINIGIVGYGNLGKCVEQEILKSDNFNLVGIFSRRKIEGKTNIFPYKTAKNYKDKIDIMIMCGGSEKDLEKQTPEMAKYFNVIDTFDTHQKTLNHYEKVDKICKKHKTNAILSCGWDPGLFSIIRVLYFSIFENYECFYGKGISLGHTNAIKQIKGVENAKQYTIPNKKAIKMAKTGKNISIPKHYRLCYIVTQSNKKKIANQVKNIPNYFKGQPTKIKFINEQKLQKKHINLSHKGNIYASYKSYNKEIFSSFSIKTSSNPMLTTRIILAYLNALNFMSKKNLYVALTPAQIPASWLLDKSDSHIIKTFC